jgi:intraflagellar transport protein 122
MQHRDQLPDNVSAEELNSEQKKTLACFYDNYQISEAYYAYHFVQRYMDEPFTSHQSESLFNMALFVLNYTNRKPVPKGISLATYIEGISRVYVLFALAKLARVLGAYKTARYAYEKLLTCVIPNEWIDMIELGTLTIRSKPKTDRKELMPICYGCGTIHPLTSGTGNMESKCSYCQEPFVNSFYSFEAIPLVRFELEEGISPYDAEKLVDTPSPTSDMGRKVRTGGDSVVGGMVTSVAGPALTDDDPFNRALLSVEKSGTYVPVTLDRQQVIALDKYLVFVRSWGKACIPNQYFKQILVSENDSAVKMCGSCQHFFHDNEW